MERGNGKGVIVGGCAPLVWAAGGMGGAGGREREVEEELRESSESRVGAAPLWAPLPSPAALAPRMSGRPAALPAAAS